jgi:hypothetical protein
MHYFSKVTLATAVVLVSCALPGYAATFTGSLNDDVRKFSPGSSVSDIIGSGAASVSLGDTSIYIGTYQKTQIDQDPIIASITNGALDWIRADYDQSSPDGRGEGLVWDTDNNLYGLFTIAGGSNENVNKFTDFTTSESWQSGYGPGGGPKVSVLLKLNPDDGSGIVGNATYIRAQVNAGNTNTLRPRAPGLELVDDRVVFSGTTFFSPFDVDGTTRIIGSGDYRLILNQDLTEACSAELNSFAPLGDITTCFDSDDSGGGDDGSGGGDAAVPVPVVDGGSGGGDGGDDGGSGGGDGGDGGSGGGDGGSGGGDGGSGGGDGGSGGGDDGSGGGDGGSGGGDGGSGGDDGGSGGGDPTSIPEPGMVIGTLVAFGATLLKKRQRYPPTAVNIKPLRDFLSPLRGLILGKWGEIAPLPIPALWAAIIPIASQ